jgi:hypothetical protein
MQIDMVEKAKLSLCLTKHYAMKVGEKMSL